MEKGGFGFLNTEKSYYHDFEYKLLVGVKTHIHLESKHKVALTSWLTLVA